VIDGPAGPTASAPPTPANIRNSTPPTPMTGRSASIGLDAGAEDAARSCSSAWRRSRTPWRDSSRAVRGLPSAVTVRGRDIPERPAPPQYFGSCSWTRRVGIGEEEPGVPSRAPPASGPRFVRAS
jgi:hypothetical protein